MLPVMVPSVAVVLRIDGTLQPCAERSGPTGRGSRRGTLAIPDHKGLLRSLHQPKTTAVRRMNDRRIRLLSQILRECLAMTHSLLS